MKGQQLSEILKETRYALRLNQKEMAQTLGMGEKMYQLYESGKYDDVGNDSVKRQKLLDKINIVKNKIVIATHTGATGKNSNHNDFAYQELEKKYQELQQRYMELQSENISLLKQLLIKPKKAVAHAITPKKN